MNRLMSASRAPTVHAQRDRFWWVLPSVLALASLAGIVIILVDPRCYLSDSMPCYEFALDNAWGSWRDGGKWGALQFFGTGLLGAAAAFSWPALRGQIVGQHGVWLAEVLNICLGLGYLALLFGIAGGIYRENPDLIGRIINKPAEYAEYIGIALLITMVLVVIIGWIVIIHTIWIAIKRIKVTHKVLLLWNYVLQVRDYLISLWPW